MQKNGQTVKDTVKQGTVSPYRYKIKSLLFDMEAGQASAIKRAVRQECAPLSRGSISRYINERRTGKDFMPVKVLQSFAKHLGKSMEELLNK